MLAFLADENFSHRVLRGVKLRIKNLDLAMAQKVGLGGVSDLALLAWAAEHQRILLTHDRQTVPRYAYDRIFALTRQCQASLSCPTPCRSAKQLNLLARIWSAATRKSFTIR